MTTAVIPSRYGSSRFEGKPLVLVAGKPMIQRVYEQAQKSKAVSKTIVATDDNRIFDAVEAFGGKAAIIKLAKSYDLVPTGVADKIALRNPSCVILCNESQKELSDDEDPYADYQVPDDLMW